MTLNASGPISIGGPTAGQSINLSFGRSANQQTSMSQLYRGGGVVPNASVNNNVPTSGPISLGQFYNARNRVPVTITLASNQTNYVLSTAQVPGYVAGITDVTLVINSGIYVSSNSTATPALDVNTSFDAADTISIVNNGTIVGMGGAGGVGQSRNAEHVSGGSAGSPGGLALRAQRAASVDNVGVIAGGGGGGGGGGSRLVTVSGKFPGTNVIGGNGGGGGRSSAAANAPGGGGGTAAGAVQGSDISGSIGGVNQNGSAGPAGTVSARGTNGGEWGAAGSLGTVETNGFGGGSGGAAVNGNSNITWVATGTRLGAIA